MAANPLLERDQIIEALGQAVSGGEHGLKLVPLLVKRVIQEDCWRERYVRVTGERVTFDRFSDFLAAQPPEGLGADLPLIKRMCADDKEALQEIKRATTGKRGRPDKGCESQPLSTKGDAGYEIERLHRERPDLHAQVIAGTKSPHAAAVEAGHRHKRVSVSVDDPDKVAAFLAKYFDPAEIRTIADLAIHLREGGG